MAVGPRPESTRRSPGDVDGGNGRVEEGSKGGFVTVDVDERGDIIQRQDAHCESENKLRVAGEHGV